MKPRQCVLSAVLVLATLAALLIVPLMPGSIQSTRPDPTNKTFSNVGYTEPSAPVPIQYQDTKYNIHYRLVEYQQVFDYQSVSYGNVIGIAGRIVGVRTSYRMMAFVNGTIQVANVTNVDAGSDETSLVKGLDFQLLPSFNVNTIDFEPQKFTEYSYNNLNVLMAGRNKTDNSIIVYRLVYNETAQSFIYFQNYTVATPGLFSFINNVIINDLSQATSVYVGNIVVSGRWKNGTSNIPFGYMIDYTTGSTLMDMTNLTTSTTDYQLHGQTIYAVRFSAFMFGYALICSNTMLVVQDIAGTIISVNNYPDIPVSTYMVYHFAIGRDDYSESVFVMPYTYWDVISNTQGSFLVEMDPTFFTVRQDPASFALLNEMLVDDTIFKATSDFSDGVIFMGIDRNFHVWQDWVLGTGSIGGLFDLYVPYKIVTYYEGTFYGGFECWFGDSRGMWVAIFNRNDTGVLGIGNSTVNKIVTQRLDVNHVRGTNSFQFSVSGYVERYNNDLVEIGVVPLYALPYITFAGDNGTMFSTTATHVFLNTDNGGIILRPARAFIGTGGMITEFSASFDADYCPIIQTIFGFPSIPLQIQYIVYERYSNGTYTQKLLRTSFNAKSVIAMFSFVLDTSISIQDSHMLDELRVLADGIEYNPYSLTFTKPDIRLHVIDKITNQTLFNEDVRFTDPLLLPIPPKYEFALLYYSSLDYFGLDFGLVNTYVNNTPVTTDLIRVLSPTARIVTTDFANTTISDVIVEKAVDGFYIKIALPIATVIISNNYNYTIIFYLVKGTTTISYSIPSMASIILRLATGHYQYIVTNTKGKEILDKEIDFTSSTSIALGEFSLNFPDDPRVQAQTEINIMVSVIGIALATGAGIILANSFANRSIKVNKRQWG